MMKRIGAASLQLPRVGVLFAGAVALLFTTEPGFTENGTLVVNTGISQKRSVSNATGFEHSAGTVRMAMAQTTVEFLVPETVTIDSGKMLVVTSGSTKNKEVGDCKPGSFPVQNAMVLDPSGGAAPKRLLSGFIPLGDAPAAGTRLRSITDGGLCGPGFRKFKGTVE